MLFLKTASRTLAVATALCLSGAATAEVIAFDLVGDDSQNLISHDNPWEDAFSSAGDGFQIYQRGVSPTIPFAVLDDSAVTFPPDGIGIIDDFNTGRFFGAVDTQNNDNSGPVSASWNFDISGFTDLSVAMDFGAMGDFESSDTFSVSYSIDGGPLATLFELIVDEAISQTYTLAGGGVFTLSDPMTLNGILLSNDLQTFSSVLAGSGSVLTLVFTGQLNGGNEGIAVQNMIISGTAAVSEPASLALFGLGFAGLMIARRRRA